MSDYLLAICERASSLFWGAARFFLLSSRLYALARNRARLWLVISGVRMGHDVFLSVMAQKDYCRFSSPTIRVYDIQAPSYPTWPCPLSSFVMQSAVFQWFVPVLLKGSF